MKNKQYILIWVGQCISLLTSSILQMAIVWYLTQKTQSATIISLATLAGYLPQAICGIYVGAIIDRFNKKKILIISDLLISLVGLILFVMGLLGELPIWVIFIVLILRSIGSAFYMPSFNAIIPLIVPRDQLTKFSGYHQGVKSISTLLSPALAAILFAIMPLNQIVLLDVLGTTIAVIFIMFVQIPNIKIKKENTSLSQEVKLGLEIVKKQGLQALVIIGGLYAIIYFPIGSLFPHIVLNYFDGTIAQSSTTEIIYGIGMLMGSFSLGIIGNKIPKIKLIYYSIFIYGIAITISGLLAPNQLHYFFMTTFLVGISNPLFMGVSIALIQSKVDPTYLGRVLSFNNSMSMLAMPFGLGLSSLFADYIGINRWYFISGILTMILAIITANIKSLQDE